MKTALMLLSFIACASCISVVNVIEEEWELFKLQFGKKYTNTIEENFRHKIFIENKHRIAKHNQNHYKGEVSFKAGLNEYMDMLPNEFFGTMNGLIYNHDEIRALRDSIPSFIEPDDDIIMPKEVDWRQKGAVTPVKNQGQCGSCWAFSTTGSLEGQHFRRSGELVSLSEQNLVDCSKNNSGCNGGMMDNAFMYIKKNGGIDTEESYPYKGVDEDQCYFEKSDVGADDKGYVDIRHGSEKALMKAVATVGPISIAIDAAHHSFMIYKSGVYYEEDCSDMQLDHGVLCVGYGTTEDGEDYWLVKNSWGTSWGEEGYVKMARNRQNNCGVATMASYPST